MPTETFFNLPDEKKERIIEAAVDEFAENGFENAKVNEIVRKSSIPKGSFYQYFRDKSDIFKYILDIVFEKKMQMMTGIRDSLERSSIFEILRIMVGAAIKMAEDDPRLSKISDDLVANKSLMNKILGEYSPSSNDLISSLIKRGKDTGEISEWVDPEMAAKLITAFMLSLSEMVRSDSEGMLSERARDKYLSLIKLLEYGMKRREDYD
ncbi:MULTISPECIES: TetR/AcrR family transcriptional regulator [unclassified Mesotoga]|uniref:TetR/AcrR family transcriptional regulator n=1 Tax=unclassified Mesotoga TaxID=1184398 RepID=UPI001BD68F39|nr:MULTISPECIES: TetR/AcrR family transcriptional regulator [unclassified Mesotoga]MDD3461194.1 TetR/AcrR family transcriptional regulator [Mesotoga sp.]